MHYQLTFHKKIQSMLTNVHDSLSSLLQSITMMYRLNGVNFNAKSQVTTIMRIISPFELISYFGLTNHYGLFIEEHEQVKKLRFFEERKQNKDINFKKDNQMSLNSQIKLKQENIDNSKHNHCKLTKQQQLLLCQWIQEEVSMKKRITTEQILSEARRIANSKNFKGSFSWYRRFKLRHPEITNLVKQYQYQNEFSKFVDFGQNANDKYQEKQKLSTQKHKPIIRQNPDNANNSQDQSESYSCISNIQNQNQAIILDSNDQNEQIVEGMDDNQQFRQQNNNNFNNAKQIYKQKQPTNNKSIKSQQQRTMNPINKKLSNFYKNRSMKQLQIVNSHSRNFIPYQLNNGINLPKIYQIQKNKRNI